MRILHLFICLLFLLFAAVQYNDPDPYIWVPIYVFVALEFGLAFFRKALPYPVLLGGLAILTIYLLTYLPDLYNWVKMGEPSIVETMKADRPWVELTREALGLLICVVSLGVRVWQRKRV